MSVAVVGALVTGLTAGLSPSAVVEHRVSARPAVASWEETTAANHYSLEAGAGALPAEELIQLTEVQIEEILDESDEAVTEAQQQFAGEVSPTDYAKAVTAYEAISAQLDQIIATEGMEGLIERFPEDATITSTSPQEDDGVMIQTVAKRCMTVYKWQLQTIAWIAIGYGALVSIAALFAGAVTIVGLPAGAVVGALGIGLGVLGSFFLWKVDQQRWNSKRVCF